MMHHGILVLFTKMSMPHVFLTFTLSDTLVAIRNRRNSFGIPRKAPRPWTSRLAFGDGSWPVERCPKGNITYEKDSNRSHRHWRFVTLYFDILWYNRQYSCQIQHLVPCHLFSSRGRRFHRMTLTWSWRTWSKWLKSLGCEPRMIPFSQTFGVSPEKGKHLPYKQGGKFGADEADGFKTKREM